MTHRERLLAVLNGKIPDHVPASPDVSNMIPARLTGKPFWDLYLYNDPPIWEAYIDCVKHFEIDALMDGYFPLEFAEEKADRHACQQESFIVFENSERIVVQTSWTENGKRMWQEGVDVYYVADPPSYGVKPGAIGLASVPETYRPIEGVRPVDTGPSGLRRVLDMMGDQGLVGIWLASSCALQNEDAIYHYYDHPEKHEQWAQERVDKVEQRFRRIMAMEAKPDFLCVGGSGTLVFQSLEIFRQLAFPAVKRAIELASSAGIPTQVHSCGPEKDLVKIMVEETDLAVIDPLEIPPMGDCNLAELKRLYGSQITLKGNLHTTNVMLKGTPDDVIAASKNAIDDAATDGRFILSTGDQCGRDTPDENLVAMMETARAYGSY